MSKKEMFILSSDYDNSPVVIYMEEFGIIFEGDNMHNNGFWDFAEGFSKAYTALTSVEVEQIQVDINEIEDLETNKVILEKTKSYVSFKDTVE